jgi:ATP-binding cassette, subfamily F, member 3
MLVSLNNVTFEFGARAIIKNASWTIFPKERIGLIGANGMGKSTVLKLIVNEYSPTGGSVEKSKETTIGYFHQDLQSLDTSENILEVAAHAFDRAKQIQKELTALEQELEHNSTDEKLTLYTDKLHDFEVAGGYEMEHKTAQVLEGLGFTTEQLSQAFSTFSGGWRMRVMLAKMILQQPDLLLLDEPTNHLDLPSIQWLEGFLQSYPGSVVIISHDRFFLDRMVTKIVEVSQQTLNIYSGNYEFYENEKEVRLEFQQREYENQQDYIKQQERFIERFKAKASKAAAAQSAIKRLDKLDVKEAPTNTNSVIKINFQIDKQPGKVVHTLEQVGKNYGKLNILTNGNAEIMRGDKIALVGANGKGKSTLLRIIAGTESFTGNSNIGYNVDTSFYAQHQLESLDMKSEILDELKDGTSGYTEPELRTLLGCFLFNGDDVFKKISILSGGEKARVALAKTIIAKSNFMLLDEPTNHLDLNSVNMLADALIKYQGTLLIVSHDRYFVSKVANKYWEIIDGAIQEYSGTYDEWIAWKEKRALQEKNNNKTAEAKPIVVEKKPEHKPEEPKLNTAIDKEAKKELRNLQNQFTKIEEALNKANEEKIKIETALAHPDTYANKDKFLQLEKDYEKASLQAAELQTQYEKIFEQLLEKEN